MFHKLTRLLALLFITSCVLLGNSCRIVQTLSTRHLIKSFETMVDSINSHPDPDLVGQSFPTFLILLDSLIVSNPNNLDLLYTGTLAYSTYCQAFLVPENNMERASILYERAKNYGFRLLEQQKILHDVQTVSVATFENDLLRTNHKDVPYIYVSGAAWLGWILANSDSMEAIADLPKAISLLQRVIKLDDSFNNGDAHLILGIYYAVQPRGAGQDLKQSKFHFNKAIELGGDDNLLSLVTYAEYYATATLDETLFSDLLNQIMQTDLSKRPDIRLSNELALKHAKNLWEKKEEFF